MGTSVVFLDSTSLAKAKSTPNSNYSPGIRPQGERRIFVDERKHIHELQYPSLPDAWSIILNKEHLRRISVIFS